MPLRVTSKEAKVLQLTIEGGAEEVKQKGKRDNEEEREQALFFARRDEYKDRYPALQWMFATLNGVYIPKPLLRQALESGMTAGVLDIWLPWRREEAGAERVIPGLAMDMKAKKGRPSERQLEWAQMLVSCGWRVYFPHCAVEAWWIVAGYLGIVGADHFAADLERQSNYARVLAGK